MKRQKFFMYLSGVLILLLCGIGIAYAVHQHVSATRAPLSHEQIQTNTQYALYSVKNNGQHIEAAAGTVIIVELPKADYEQAVAVDALHAAVEVNHEDVDLSVANSLVLKGREEITVSAKSKYLSKSDFSLTIESTQSTP